MRCKKTPSTSDRKVIGTHNFQDTAHRTIQIYDWKVTALYDARPEADTLPVLDFWASDVPQEFSVTAAAAIDFPAFAQ